MKVICGFYPGECQEWRKGDCENCAFAKKQKGESKMLKDPFSSNETTVTPKTIIAAGSSSHHSGDVTVYIAILEIKESIYRSDFLCVFERIEDDRGNNCINLLELKRIYISKDGSELITSEDKEKIVTNYLNSLI